MCIRFAVEPLMINPSAQQIEFLCVTQFFGSTMRDGSVLPESTIDLLFSKDNRVLVETNLCKY